MELSNGWAKGGKGTEALAERIVKVTAQPNDFAPIYEVSDPIKKKIETIARVIYGADSVEYSEEAEEKIKLFIANGWDRLPVCMMSEDADDVTWKDTGDGISVRYNDADYSASENGNVLVLNIDGDQMQFYLTKDGAAPRWSAEPKLETASAASSSAASASPSAESDLDENPELNWYGQYSGTFVAGTPSGSMNTSYEGEKDDIYGTIDHDGIHLQGAADSADEYRHLARRHPGGIIPQFLLLAVRHPRHGRNRRLHGPDLVCRPLRKSGSISEGRGSCPPVYRHDGLWKHVTFSYSGSPEPSLQDISFAAAPGETIGIIGGTGSGKSTLVSLIPRFYDATSGRVLVDGIDVRSYRQEDLIEKLGIVPQKAVLFQGTIRENLLLGRADADEASLRQALRTAQAEEIVAGKALGLEEPIEQGGRNLSGGQRQRLAIARALARKPEILILDDSASALDYATDAGLRRALRRDERGTTVFLVSQRAASIRHA